LRRVLAGNTSFYAVGQWIAGCSPTTLAAFGARIDPSTGRHTGPEEKTLRGLCARLDGDALDVVVGPLSSPGFDGELISWFSGVR
jgi:hypothetical protein